jgi:hypothetical protein
MTQYLPTMPQLNLPVLDWPPTINLDIGSYLFTPFVTLGIMLREFLFGTQSKDHMKMALDEERYQILLKHIDNYIDNTIGQKLNDNNDAIMKDVNDRLLVMITNNVKDAIIKYEYKLTTKDIDEIILNIRKYMDDELNQRDKTLIAKLSLANEEVVERINVIASENIDNTRNIKIDNQNFVFADVVDKILNSEKLFAIVDGRLMPIFERLETHDANLLALRADLDQLKMEILEKSSAYSNDINSITTQQKAIADDLYEYKLHNDQVLKNLLLQLDEKMSGITSIDASVRNSLLSILGFDINKKFDENSIKEWIKSTFVAKGYLEERLNDLELNSNKNFRLQLDKNAGILMEEVNKEIEKQIVLALKENHHNVKVSGSLLTEEDILRIVKDVLAVS